MNMETEKQFQKKPENEKTKRKKKAKNIKQRKKQTAKKDYQATISCCK